MKPLLEVLKEGKILISDGAWNTMLRQRGMLSNECPELWNISHRKDVLAIAKSYVESGADIIQTNSVGGSTIKLSNYGLCDKAFELNKAAAVISREAAGEKCYVLGSVGSTGRLIITGDVTEKELIDGFSLQADALKKGGVDAILIENMSDIEEATLAVRTVKEVTGLPVICTFTFEKTIMNEFRTMMGITPSKIVEPLLKSGASIIGSNCGNGITQMIKIVEEIRKVNDNIPVLVQANAGKPTFVDGETVYPETPEDMVAKVPELIDAGANIIGGCCGTSPAHIKLIAKTVGKYN